MRAVAVWTVLVIITLTSWELASSAVASAVILAAAMVKSALIGLEFMDLRGAPWPLRAAYLGWCTAIGAALGIILLA